MPRAGRKTATALVISSVFVMGFLAAFGGPAMAQDGNETATGGDAGGASGNATGGAGSATGGAGDAAGDVPRTVTIRAQEAGCSDGRDFCWDIENVPIGAGETVKVIVDLSKANAPHNFHVEEPIDQKTEAEMGVVQELTFTVAADQRGAIDFLCDVHDKEMFGSFLPPAAFAQLSAGGHEEVPEMGVHFLAYWVGLIAFAILFVVYGITFFLFKYNETSATTDHWDRSGAEPAGKRVGGGVAGLLAVVIAVAAIGAIIWLARFR
jgi:plastocyanin